MVREARKQVSGLFLVADQANRDMLASFAKQCPDRTVSVWRDRKNGGALRVSLCGKPGRCVRAALECIRRAMGRAPR